MLHHPDLQLDEAVGIKALVLPHTAVPDFVATEIQLTMWSQRSDFGIPDFVVLQDVDQASVGQNNRKEYMSEASRFWCAFSF